MKRKTSKSIESPASVYHAPQEVVDDEHLSPKEKMKALRNWEDEETSLLRAADENMAPQGGPASTAPDPADMLKKIQKAERVLEQKKP